MPESASQRRLLIVDPCDECHQLLPGLRNIGWEVRSSALDTALEHPCDVGVLRLQAQHLRHPDAVKDMIKRSNTEWIAVLSAEELRMQNVGDFVCEWFFDFHTLPFDVSRVQVTLGRAFGMARLRGKGAVHLDEPQHELLGESRPIRELRKLLGKLAPTESPVLICGESGTGKELVARTLHRQSQRRDQPFIAINCGAIPEHLIQSELFGHEKGAFTGAHQRKVGRIEAANGGTLFLDEIGDLPLELQANLLRFLQEKHIERVGSNQPIPVDVRVLAATHVDLDKAIEQGRFREDLYYRLNVLQVVTAPCATVMATCRCSPATLPISTAWKPAGARGRSATMHWPPWAGMIGRAMYASWPIGCGVAWCWPRGGRSRRRTWGCTRCESWSNPWERWRITSNARSARRCAMCSTATATTSAWRPGCWGFLGRRSIGCCTSIRFADQDGPSQI